MGEITMAKIENVVRTNERTKERSFNKTQHIKRNNLRQRIFLSELCLKEINVLTCLGSFPVRQQQYYEEKKRFVEVKVQFAEVKFRKN